MKTLTAVVVFILLAITAGGVTGYFLYTDLVKDEARIIVRQQSEIDTQAENIQTLQKEIIAQNNQLNKDTKTINTVVDILTQILKPVEENQTPDIPSSFDNSSFRTAPYITPSSN